MTLTMLTTLRINDFNFIKIAIFANVDCVDDIDNVDNMDVTDNMDDVEHNNKMQCYECNARNAI